jgi:hypothetical protein
MSLAGRNTDTELNEQPQLIKAAVLPTALQHVSKTLAIGTTQPGNATSNVSGNIGETDIYRMCGLAKEGLKRGGDSGLGKSLDEHLVGRATTDETEGVGVVGIKCEKAITT